MEEKEQGNCLVREKKCKEALACYSKAIAKLPDNAVLYMNRALCHLRLNNWSLVIEDCERTIELDPSLIKAHFYKGEAQMELNLLDSAVESLKTAYYLSKEQRRNFGDDITRTLRLAKRKRWEMLENQRLTKKTSLLTLLLKLLDDHRDRKLVELEKDNLPVEQHEKKTEEITQEHLSSVTELNQLFEDADERRKQREIPDYLCGKISFELMHDPIITPSGITYDRKDIEEHLHRVGHFDPVTRKRLTHSQLIPNLSMKEVVDAFVAKNGWAEEF